MCIQRLDYVPLHKDFNRMDENCLYLNVYIPKVENSRKPLEVFVFVHGGSNIQGMGAMLDGHVLAAFGQIIVVTFNYRLGVFGFLGTGSKNFPGNYGIMDQIMALKWVNKNIGNFGGDPSKVTLAGHSAGGADVALHLLSPLSKGLFRYLICMSGLPLQKLTWTSASSLDTRISDLVEASNCPRNSSVLKNCLKKMPLARLQQMEINLFGGYSPVIQGGAFLPEEPEALIKTSSINSHYIMMGLVTDERGKYVHFGDLTWNRLKFYMSNRYHMSKIIDLIKFEYSYATNPETGKIERTAIQPSKALGEYMMLLPTIEFANRIKNQSNSIVYLYQFDYLSATAPNPDFGVNHGTDLFYLFGYPLIGFHRTKRVQHNYTELDKEMSTLYMKTFVRFIKYGDPLVNDTDDKRDFDTRNGRYIYFHETSHKNRSSVEYTIKHHMRERKVHFWTKFLPFMREVLESGTARGDGPSFLTLVACIYTCLSLLLFG